MRDIFPRPGKVQEPLGTFHWQLLELPPGCSSAQPKVLVPQETFVLTTDLRTAWVQLVLFGSLLAVWAGRHSTRTGITGISLSLPQYSRYVYNAHNSFPTIFMTWSHNIRLILCCSMNKGNVHVHIEIGHINCVAFVFCSCCCESYCEKRDQ